MKNITKIGPGTAGVAQRIPANRRSICKDLKVLKPVKPSACVQQEY